MATPATNGELRERLWWLGDLLEVVGERMGLWVTGIGAEQRRRQWWRWRGTRAPRACLGGRGGLEGRGEEASAVEGARGGLI
mgnify:CR=1 FL=1